MTRPGALGREAKFTQPLPASGLVHGLAGQRGDAAGQFGACPQATVGGAAEQFALELLLLCGRQPRGTALAAGIARDGDRPAGIVTLDEFADAVGGQADEGGGLGARARRLRSAEQPQSLPAGLLSAIAAVAEAFGQLFVGQMRHQL